MNLQISTVSNDIRTYFLRFVAKICGSKGGCWSDIPPVAFLLVLLVLAASCNVQCAETAGVGCGMPSE